MRCHVVWMFKLSGLLRAHNLLFPGSHAANVYICTLRSRHVRLPRSLRSRNTDLLISIHMSQPPSPSPSKSTCIPSSNFRTIFYAALKAYEKKTKKDLLAHPLAAQLQACKSPDDILAVLQDKVTEFNQSMSADERLSQWLNPTINVLYSFSATIGAGIGLVSAVKSTCFSSNSSPISQVFSPASVIFSGIGVLLSVSIVFDLCVEVILTMKSISGSQRR